MNSTVAHTPYRLLLAVTTATLLSSCGQYGNLYLPTATPEEQGQEAWVEQEEQEEVQQPEEL